ncbi:hypothetical protein [Ferrimonas pelagia]|uniref:hypothetical protein n=1 Tax=Ferrimonas pelagia TaxID=1177826 RepID=UPI0031E7724F
MVGLISGIILTQLIPINLDAVAQAAGDEVDTGPSSEAAIRITLALIGGFSADLMYRILNRLVEAVQSLLSPSALRDPNLDREAVRTQFQREQQQHMQTLSRELNQLQQQLLAQDAITPQEVQRLLGRFSDQLHNKD